MTIIEEHQDDIWNLMGLSSSIYYVAQYFSHYHRDFPIVLDVSFADDGAVLSLSNKDEIHITRMLQCDNEVEKVQSVKFSLYSSKPGKLGSHNYHLKDSYDVKVDITSNPGKDQQALDRAIKNILLESFFRIH